MPQSLASLSLCLENALGSALVQTFTRLDELTIAVNAKDLAQTMRRLRDHDDCRFEQLIDLCGLDYSEYGDGVRVLDHGGGARFAVVYHLLSVSLNQRVRVRVFCPDDDLPLVASMVDIWPSANWFEREAFDLYGIVFEGHPDCDRPFSAPPHSCLRARCAAQPLAARSTPADKSRAAGSGHSAFQRCRTTENPCGTDGQ